MPPRLVPPQSPANADCLDGTHPGYYLRKGANSNANKWIVYFQVSASDKEPLTMGSGLFFQLSRGTP